MDLSEATWTDAADFDADVAVLPVGSTEQHGPHAPLGTDTLTAKAVAEAGVEASPEDVPIAPTIPVGIAAEHRHFAGTLWVSPDAFRSYVGDVITSLAYHGWKRVVVVNGHGGNVDALRECCARIARDGEAYAVPFTWFEAVASLSEMGHSGPIETAFLRAVHPDLVREDRIEDASANAARQWGEWVSKANLAVDSAEFTENGVVGDPAVGTDARGAELLEDAAEALAALLEAIADRSLERPTRK